MEDGLKDIGRIVSRLFRKICETLCVLDDRASTLEAHTRIDMFGGKIAEAAISFGIVLNKD